MYDKELIDIAMKQLPVVVTGELIFIVYMACLACVCWYSGVYLAKKNKLMVGTEFTGLGVIWLVLTIFIGIICLVFIPWSIRILININVNPEYWVLEHLMPKIT